MLISDIKLHFSDGNIWVQVPNFSGGMSAVGGHWGDGDSCFQFIKLGRVDDKSFKQWVALTAVSNSLSLGGWMTIVLNNGWH